MKFRFAAFRISSMDMKMTMMLRRVSTPATPMANSSARDDQKLREVWVPHALLMLSSIESWSSRSAGVKRLFIIS